MYGEVHFQEFYIFTRLPVTRWVKLSLNFELLVKRVMQFLLDQRLLITTFFVQLELFRIQKQPRKLSKRKSMREN